MCLDLVQPNKYIIVLRLHTKKPKHHCLLATFEASKEHASKRKAWSLRTAYGPSHSILEHTYFALSGSLPWLPCIEGPLEFCAQVALCTLHTNGATTMSDTHTGCITGAPLALIKHKFKQKIINHFKMVIVEHSAKHGPFRVTHSWTWLIDSCS